MGRTSLALLRLRWAVADLCVLLAGIAACLMGLLMWLVWALRWPLAVAFVALLAYLAMGGAS